MADVIGGPAGVPGSYPGAYYPPYNPWQGGQMPWSGGQAGAGYRTNRQNQWSPSPYAPPAPVSPWWGGGAPTPWGAGAGQQPYPNWEDFYGSAPGGAPEVQSWMNTYLPWYQQAQQQQQFEQQMGYQGWLTEQQLGWDQAKYGQGLDWERQQQQNQLGFQGWQQAGQWGQDTKQQREQLGYQRWATEGGWGQETAMQGRELGSRAALQTEQLAVQQAIEEQRARAQETQAAWSAFGRAVPPNVRWLS